MSQLGYMITILGLKYNNLSLFHLMFHAYFKALLFLTAGAIIHTIFDLQDFRKTGGLLNLLPLQNILSIIGLSSLIGLPFSTGFYSKESILNNSYTTLNLLAQYSYIILIISALLTIFYSYRFFYVIFLGETKLSLFIFKNIHFYSLHLLIPLFILALLTIFIGFIFSKWIHFNNLFILPFSFNIPLFIKLLPLLFMLIILFSFIYLNNYINNFVNIYLIFLFKQYSFKLLYQFISGFFFAISYRVFFKLFDYGFWDLIGPITGSLYLNNLSSYMNKNIFNNLNAISLLLFILILII